MFTHKPSAPLRHPRQGDALKVVLITIGVIFVIGFLACAGGGFYVYWQFQKHLGRAVITDPLEIKKMSAEIVDLDVPSEFTPAMGSAIFGMKNVHYAWNPTNQPIATDDWSSVSDQSKGLLTLTEMPQDPQAPVVSDPDFDEDESMDWETSDDYLKEYYSEYTKTERALTIRGKTCKFTLIVGRRWPELTLDMDEEAVMVDDPFNEDVKPEVAATDPTNAPATEPAPATNTAPATDPAVPPETVTEIPGDTEKPAAPAAAPIDRGEPLPPMRTVTGSFPSKGGQGTINIRVPVDGTTDDMLWKILQSIR